MNAQNTAIKTSIEIIKAEMSEKIAAIKEANNYYPNMFPGLTETNDADENNPELDKQIETIKNHYRTLIEAVAKAYNI